MRVFCRQQFQIAFTSEQVQRFRSKHFGLVDASKSRLRDGYLSEAAKQSRRF